MITALTEDVVYDPERSTVTFYQQGKNAITILDSIEYLEETNPYRSWIDIIAEVLPMLDPLLIPNVRFIKENRKGEQ